MSNSKNKKLFAGPYLGEFGWELFCWQGYIRHLSRSFDFTTVCCREGHAGLYKDFADEIIQYNPPQYHPECQKNIGDCGPFPKPKGYQKYIGPNDETSTPAYQSANGIFSPNPPQEFFKYGNINSDKQKYDILIHARSRKLTGARVSSANRNLPTEKWDEIVNYLKSKKYSIASIGSKKESLLIDGTKNLRGIPLEDLCDYCVKSKCMLSPSSGPLHLAALCGTSIIVWSGAGSNKFRYEKAWNPFNNKVQYLNGWHNVKVDHIKNAIDNLDE